MSATLRAQWHRDLVHFYNRFLGHFGGCPALSVIGIDLHRELNAPGLRAGLMDALREAVRTGRLVPGTRLPSSRSLAADLGVARYTVADSYAELITEGWLIATNIGTHVTKWDMNTPL